MVSVWVVGSICQHRRAHEAGADEAGVAQAIERIARFDAVHHRTHVAEDGVADRQARQRDHVTREELPIGGRGGDRAGRTASEDLGEFLTDDRRGAGVEDHRHGPAALPESHIDDDGSGDIAIWHRDR